MVWNYERSRERAQKRWDATASVTVGDVQRETDFENIGLSSPKRLTGAHVYVDISNFNGLLRSGALDQREAVRRLHIWQREASRVISGLESTKVHFQGPRVHVLAYRPISDQSKAAIKAVLVGSALRHSVAAFNETVATDDAWTAAVGIDHGQVTATKNGTKADRELLFLGPAANHAAKLLQQSGIRISAAVADLLPAAFDPYITEAAEGCSVMMSVATTEELIERYGWSWSYAEVLDRLADAAKRFLLSSITVSKPGGKFDKDDLRLSNTKQVRATSVFADVDGFTALIDAAAEAEPDLVDVVRSFHTLRSEGRDTAVRDFSALRVQYQGDRMQALCYLPTADAEEEAIAAVAAAAALTSVASEVVPEIVPDGTAKPYAIGLGTGEVLVTKIGEHGNRDLVVIGASVATAAAIQGRLEGGQIGMDGTTRSALPEWMRNLFPWSPARQAYVASDLTYDALLAAAPDAEGSRVVTSALKSLAKEAGTEAPAVSTPRRAPSPTRDQGRPWLRAW